MQGDIIVHEIDCALTRAEGPCTCGADPTLAQTYGPSEDDPALEAHAAEADYQMPGPVSLIWATDEQHIAYLARVSNTKAAPDDPGEKLIAYLLRNHHWSPFEMASMCVEINTTRDITNQIIRHRSFSFQEFSTRYADVEELTYYKECRFQDDKNRQNSFEASKRLERLSAEREDPHRPSADILREIDEVQATLSYFDAVVNETRTRSMEAYQELRRRGVAKEVARCILPFGLLPSKIYMAGTVRSWIHYLQERTKPGVQKEHREIALAVKGVFDSAYPMVSSAIGLSQSD